MGFVKEFKEFAMRGNVVDMAVGIVIGAAFGKIVSSLVNDVIMPPIGLLLGGVEFKQFKFVLKEGVPGTEGAAPVPPVEINYGMFINVVVDFILVALAIFIVIKAINRLKRKEEAAPTPPAPPELTRDQQLLTEIRDALASRA